MYLNSAILDATAAAISDKQEHEMYLNSKSGSSSGVTISINRNMRCIWIYTDTQDRWLLPMINRNMRCIWIHYFFVVPLSVAPINRNMRCIWIELAEEKEYEKKDKQEHEMYLNRCRTRDCRCDTGINRNMRCIWIKKGHNDSCPRCRINRNMRCIWMVVYAYNEQYKSDKQEHEMYLNRKWTCCGYWRRLINRNMRCIWMYGHPFIGKERRKINRNMRCIWILAVLRCYRPAMQINRNMRCIWIKILTVISYIPPDKQEHEMYLNSR